MIMVDEIQQWPTKIRCFQAGSCHLMTDDVSPAGLDKLHAFAVRIGLKREWFQPLSSPHYDLTPSKRDKALAYGATFVSAHEQAKARMKRRLGAQ
jgi:Protein of unknown function (DUF4031)